MKRLAAFLICLTAAATDPHVAHESVKLDLHLVALSRHLYACVGCFISRRISHF